VLHTSQADYISLAAANVNPIKNAKISGNRSIPVRQEIAQATLKLAVSHHRIPSAQIASNHHQ